MENQNAQENSSFKDQLAKGVAKDPEQQVRETEDASLQDDSYSFDEANTDNEEYHDASDADELDLDNDEDFVQ